MGDNYASRTVAIVALVSLVVGFLVVFGGGMLLLRPRARDTAATEVASSLAPPPSLGARPNDAGVIQLQRILPTVGNTSSALATSSTSLPSLDASTAPPSVSVAGITLSPASTSRCFDQGPPTPIPGSRCDRLTGLDAHIAAKASEIAGCARPGSHGRLSLVLDFRFSTRFMRGWGTPTSNIPNAGDVAACVKRVISPLPFESIAHQHDRYLVVVHIDW